MGGGEWEGQLRAATGLGQKAGEGGREGGIESWGVVVLDSSLLGGSGDRACHAANKQGQAAWN